jgi:hypothetical protein
MNFFCNTYSTGAYAIHRVSNIAKSTTEGPLKCIVTAEGADKKPVKYECNYLVVATDPPAAKKLLSSSPFAAAGSGVESIPEARRYVRTYKQFYWQQEN